MTRQQGLVLLLGVGVVGGLTLLAVKSASAATAPLFTPGHRYSITQVIPANAGAPPTLATFQSALANATSGATAVTVSATATTTTLVIDVTGSNVSQGLFSGAVITDMGPSPAKGPAPINGGTSALAGDTPSQRSIGALDAYVLTITVPVPLSTVYGPAGIQNMINALPNPPAGVTVMTVTESADAKMLTIGLTAPPGLSGPAFGDLDADGTAFAGGYLTLSDTGVVVQ